MQNTFDNRMDGGAACCDTAVSWPAILGGAAAAAALSLMLVTLGSGLGLAFFSPTGGEETIADFTVKMAIWLIILQWSSSALAGYLAGRLRTKAVAGHTDEVFFRDTAHGLLTWSVATLFTAAFLATAVMTAVTGGAKAATTVAAGAAAGGAAGKSAAYDPIDYHVDALFRSLQPQFDGARQDMDDEVKGIFLTGISRGDFSAEDKDYLAQAVATRTGLAPDQASARVEQVITDVNALKEKAKEKADKARKASSALSIFTAFSMLIGAFIAAVTAAIGGCHRDNYPVCQK